MSNSPQALILSENHRGASLFFPRLKILFTFLLTTFFSFWVLVSLKAGTTSGPDSLKVKLNCCGGVHVALGFFMWFWPPLLLGGIMYQVRCYRRYFLYVTETASNSFAVPFLTSWTPHPLRLPFRF